MVRAKTGAQTFVSRLARVAPNPRAPSRHSSFQATPTRLGAFVRQRVAFWAAPPAAFSRQAGGPAVTPPVRHVTYSGGFRARRCPRVARAKAPLGSRQRRTRSGRRSRTLEDPVSPYSESEQA